jgi:hypothetical protein
MGCTESVQTVENPTSPSSSAEILAIMRTGSTNPMHIQYYAAMCDGCMQDEWREAVYAAGGITVLVRLLSNEDRMIRFCAVEGLVNLSCVAKYRPKIAKTANMYESLIFLIADKVRDDIGLVSRELALRLLTNSCIEFDDGSNFIHDGEINSEVLIACKAGIIPPVLDWLSDKRALTTEIIQTSLNVPVDIRATWNRITSFLPVTFFLRANYVAEDPDMYEHMMALVKNTSQVPKTDFACLHQMFMVINCMMQTTEDSALKEKLGAGLFESGVFDLFDSILQDPEDRLLPSTSFFSAMIACVEASPDLKKKCKGVSDLDTKLRNCADSVPGEIKELQGVTWDASVIKLNELCA